MLVPEQGRCYSAVEGRAKKSEDFVTTAEKVKMKQKVVQRIDLGLRVVQPIKLGQKIFNTSEEMFSYFYHLLFGWNPAHDFDQHEYEILNDLVTLTEPLKVAERVVAFRVRIQPELSSRCYVLIRRDKSSLDFNFRKCVNTLMPLPKDLFNSNRTLNLEKLFPEQRNAHKQVKRGIWWRQQLSIQ